MEQDLSRNIFSPEEAWKKTTTVRRRARKLTGEPAAVLAEAGLQVLPIHVVHRQRNDQEARWAAPSPDAVCVVERLVPHPEVLKPARREEVGSLEGFKRGRRTVSSRLVKRVRQFIRPATYQTTRHTLKATMFIQKNADMNAKYSMNPENADSMRNRESGERDKDIDQITALKMANVPRVTQMM